MSDDLLAVEATRVIADIGKSHADVGVFVRHLLQENARVMRGAAWLAFRAHDGDATTEDQIAEGVGVTVTQVRTMIAEGRTFDEVMRSARAARTKGSAAK